MAENFVNSKNNKNDCNVEYCSGMGNKEKVLELLHTDCRISLEQMATMLDIPAAEVADIIDTMEKDTEIKLDIDCEKLYYNMVDCNAEWLYTLPQWDSILSAERRKELYRNQKNSGTIRREEPKIGRNDPCPCGSGKKYKKCCGRNK